MRKASPANKQAEEITEVEAAEGQADKATVAQEALIAINTADKITTVNTLSGPDVIILPPIDFNDPRRG